MSQQLVRIVVLLLAVCMPVRSVLATQCAVSPAHQKSTTAALDHTRCSGHAAADVAQVESSVLALPDAADASDACAKCQHACCMAVQAPEAIKSIAIAAVDTPRFAKLEPHLPGLQPGTIFHPPRTL
jgi:hypothetical protein